jgi:hypothetical protein
VTRRVFVPAHAGDDPSRERKKGSSGRAAGWSRQDVPSRGRQALDAKRGTSGIPGLPHVVCAGRAIPLPTPSRTPHQPTGQTEQASLRRHRRAQPRPRLPQSCEDYLDIGETLKTKFGDKSDAWSNCCLRSQFQGADYATARERWCSEIDGYEARLQKGLHQVKQILELWADVNADGGYAPKQACGAGNTVLIKVLHEAGASLQRRTHGVGAYYGDLLGSTYRCGANHVEAARLLVDLGCKPTGIDICYAEQSGSYGVASFFKDLGLNARSPGGDPRHFFTVRGDPTKTAPRARSFSRCLFLPF